MKVNLAGYNVDAEALGEVLSKTGPRQDLSPETISAAYARISRDPRSIEEIRRDARREVERARKSNQTIIFKMGHHSVAEHAIFNLDIIGLSRYALEEVEKFRLCSYTEKSQRYITLQDDFVIPQEIKATPWEGPFVAAVREQNAFYRQLLERLKAYVFKKNPEIASDSKKHHILEGWAKEDARYITALATEAQLGLTINARNLELMLRRFASHPLKEVQELGRKIYELVEKIAPSIIIFHQANDLDQKTYPELRELVSRKLASQSQEDSKDVNLVKLIDYTPQGDELIAASLLHTSSKIPFEKCHELIRAMSEEEKKEIFKTACRHLQLYDSTLREFEYVNLTFELIVSAACFGQLKRHRLTTLTSQKYNPTLGLTIPPSIAAVGLEGEFENIVEKTNRIYYQIYKELPEVAPYVLTNAHQKRVLIRANVRELYHMSRLREDRQAQWDIREKTHQMCSEARKVMPLAFMLVGGKDNYPKIYEKVYGHPPKITEAILPGARSIKT